MGTCTSGAIGSITSAGKVGCVPAPPQEFGTSSGQTTLGSGSTPIASKSLPGGSSYLVFAYPHAVLTSGSAQHVELDCTQAKGTATVNVTTTINAIQTASNN